MKQEHTTLKIPWEARISISSGIWPFFGTKRVLIYLFGWKEISNHKKLKIFMTEIQGTVCARLWNLLLCVCVKLVATVMRTNDWPNCNRNIHFSLLGHEIIYTQEELYNLTCNARCYLGPLFLSANISLSLFFMIQKATCAPRFSIH